MKEFIYKNDTIKEIKRNTPPTSIMNNLTGSVYHRNYLDYLSKCYASHNGIVIKPDYIWYTILCEIAIKIKDNPENYRQIFTTSDGKTDILVYTDDPILMPIDDLIDEVFKFIPSGISKEDILLNFSTTTDSSKFCFSTAFLDAVSPYYNYMMYMCGFNKIKVLGTIEDYEMIRSKLITLSPIFGSEMLEYFSKCSTVIKNIIEHFDDQDFWKDIFYVELCGSGHQEEVKGWFSDLYDKYPNIGYVENFSSHVSLVEYKNISTNFSYKMSSGILSSTIEEDYLLPDFGYYINEK